jgi:6-phosphofructokinase
MRIGILTGGGDVPGLNPCIKQVVYRAAEDGHEVIGIRRGWHGLLAYNPDDPDTHKACIRPLTKTMVRTIDRTGGTFLHTSRTKPSRTKWKDAPAFLRPSGDYDEEEVHDFTDHVIKALNHMKLDVLIPVGGEDTLGYGARIHSEGFPVVSIPKTMDNDVPGTEYCIGFSTAISRAVLFINQMRSAIGSHERIGVLELFGRHSGATSLVAGLLSGADRVVIAEVPFEIDKLAGFLVKDREANPSNYAVLTISEGATQIGGEIIQRGEEDAFGHKKLGGVGKVTSDRIKDVSGVGTMFQQVGYLMRSGPPDSVDIMAASNFANLAMDLIEQKELGRMVALQGGRYTHVPADTPAGEARRVDVEAFYDRENYIPKVKQTLGKPLFLY